MDITVTTAQGRVPVSIIQVAGQLDGQSYQKLIEEAARLYKGGARDFLIDLSKVSFMSSAGMVALHTVELVARGEKLPDLEQGWATLKSMGGRRGTKSEHVRLLSPSPEVEHVLEMVGFTQAFDILSDQEAAVQAFG
jgi:anti-anti-sigma regulatory factor